MHPVLSSVENKTVNKGYIIGDAYVIMNGVKTPKIEMWPLIIKPREACYPGHLS